MTPCCCNICRAIEVNATKPHSGYRGISEPFRGSWNATADDPVFNWGRIQAVENLLFFAAYGHGPIKFNGRVAPRSCDTERFLRIKVYHNSAVPRLGGAPGEYDIVTNEGSAELDRKTGYLKTAAFYITINGTTGLFWSAELDMDTGVYTIVNNAADYPVTAGAFHDFTHAQLQSGGSASAVVTGDSITLEYYIPNINFSFGHDGTFPSYTQRSWLKLENPYNEGDLFADLEAMLDAVDFNNLATGDSTNTFRPLMWNRDYTIGYTQWPPVLKLDDYQYCFVGTAPGPQDQTRDNATTDPPLFFSPLVARLYAPQSYFFDTTLSILGNQMPMVLDGLTPTDFNLSPSIWSPCPHPGCKQSRQFHCPPFPATSGGDSGSGTSDCPVVGLFPDGVYEPEWFWGFLAKAKIQFNKQDVCMFDLEQTPCSAVYDFTTGSDTVDELNFRLSGNTDCDPKFVDGETGGGTCEDHDMRYACAYPGDMLFDKGVALLFPKCYRPASGSDCPRTPNSAVGCCIT